MPAPDFATLLSELPEFVAPAEESPIDARVLDATLRLVAEYGERRLTIDDIADASRVARSTIFRRFGSKDALLQRLYLREVRVTIWRVIQAAAGAADARSALEAGCCCLVDHAGGHPVIRRIARVEPDIMVELWRTGAPSGLALLTAVLEAVVAGHDGAGEIDDRAAAIAADTLARLLFAHLLLPAATPADLAGPDRSNLVRAVVGGLLDAGERSSS
jgi:AcrR family transcriptional regulator